MILNENNFSDSLQTPALAAGLSITVADASQLPVLSATNYMMMTLEVVLTGVREIVKATGVAGNVITIERAQEGTTALDFAAGDTVQARLTAGMLNYLRDNPVVWRGNWGPGTYRKNEMVLDTGWTMIALVETTDRAAPQPSGLASYQYSGSAPESAVVAKQVIFGNRYSPVLNIILSNYRVNVIIGNHYTIYGVLDPLGDKIITEIADFVASITGWLEISKANVNVRAGTVFDMVVIVSEPDPTPSTFNGDWSYTLPNNITAPSSGQITHSNKQLDVLNIHKTDFLGGNRATELQNLDIGDVIDDGTIRWSIQNSTDNGTYMSYAVAPSLQSSSGTKDFIFETVSPTPITRMEDVNYWAVNNPLIQGIYAEDDIYDNVAVNDNAYGIDVFAQELTASEDWDVVSLSGSGGGGSDSAFLNDLIDVDAPSPVNLASLAWDDSAFRWKSVFFDKVDRAGDTMTGPLTLPGNPTNPLEATPKQYVDGIAGAFVSTDDTSLITNDVMMGDGSKKITKAIRFGGNTLRANEVVVSSTGLSNNEIAVGDNVAEKRIKPSGKAIEETLTNDAAKVPTSAAIAAYIAEQIAPLSNRNILINGSFAIWQRNSNWANPADEVYTVDRWVRQRNVNTLSVDKIVTTSTDVGIGSQFFMQCQKLVAAAAQASADYMLTTQRVEGHNARRLRWGKTDAIDAALSFKTAHSVAGNYCIAIRNAAHTRSFVFEYQQSVANVWEEHSVIIPGETDSTKWDAALQASHFLNVAHTHRAGSNLQTPSPNAWADGNFIGTSSMLDCLTFVAIFRYAEVQLEPVQVTSFEHLDYDTEYLRCCRYYEKSHSINNYPGVSTSAIGSIRTVIQVNASSVVYGMRESFHTRKRSTPTITWYPGSSSTAAGNIRDLDSDTNRSVSATQKASQHSTGIPNLANTRNKDIRMECHWTAEAELA